MKRLLPSVATVVMLAAGSVAVPASVASGAGGYLAPTTSITPAGGCVRLTPGTNGIKVRLVQRRLGMGSRWETMDGPTIERVQAFQRRRGLHRHDGVVDRRTWNALGLSERFCFDRWQARPALTLDATRRQRVRTMLRFAMRYRGAEYVWGGAGRPRYGVDCSGLVLQALYRAGLDPQPISIDKHVLPRYRTSKAMFEHDRLRHVPLARKRRGDLIFYRKDSTGGINHVALYLGNGRMVQAKGENVHVAAVRRHYPDQTIVASVVRPF